MSKGFGIGRSFRGIHLVVAVVVTVIAVPVRVLAQDAPPTDTTPPKTGCLSGYPDGTYRGDQPVTRNEFAAGVNECLNQVRPVFDRSNLVTREDMEALIQRQRELNAELKQLSGRVGNLSGE